MKWATPHDLVLSIAPSARGFGYVIFEGRTDLIDWGVKEVRKDINAGSLAKARKLITIVRPSFLILEDAEAKDSRRAPRIRALTNEIASLGMEGSLEVHQIARHEMREFFGKHGGTSKDAIAATVARFVPALAKRLPKRRRIWESERYAMAMFDAAAFAVMWLSGMRIDK